MKNEQDQVKEALVRQGMNFLLDNEIVNNDMVINDLITAGFMASKRVQDVELFIDEKEKHIEFVLFFNYFSYHIVSQEKLYNNLNNFVTSGLKDFKVTVTKKRYKKKEITNA